MSPEKLLACDNTRFNNYHSSLYYNYRLTVLKSINETFHWAINYLTHCVSCSTFTISLKKNPEFLLCNSNKRYFIATVIYEVCQGFFHEYFPNWIFSVKIWRERRQIAILGVVYDRTSMFCKHSANSPWCSAEHFLYLALHSTTIICAPTHFSKWYVSHF